MKYLLILILVVAVVAWLRWSGGRARRPPAAGAPRPPAGTPPAAAPPMVACAHCGLHLPRSEALPGPDGLFCSDAHRRAHAEAPGEGGAPR